jgi:hypothetical protein
MAIRARTHIPAAAQGLWSFALTPNAGRERVLSASGRWADAREMLGTGRAI